MLTDAVGAVDGIWLPVSEIARQKGISKQAVSKRVARFCDQGLLETKTGDRGAVLVNLVEYDRIAGEVTDFAREQGGRPAAERNDPGDSASASYTKAQADEKRYKAEMARLDLEQRLGKVLPIEQVERAMIRVAENIVRQIDRLPARTDDPAMRRLLKDFSLELRTEIASSMSQLFDEGRAEERSAAAGPVFDESEED